MGSLAPRPIGIADGVDFVPPEGGVWREERSAEGPDVVIAHNDAAPYNAVWRGGRLSGFIDWDMAGPRPRIDDLGRDRDLAVAANEVTGSDELSRGGGGRRP